MSLGPCKVFGTESPGALEDERMSQDNGDKDLKMQKKEGGGGRKEAKKECIIEVLEAQSLIDTLCC